MGKHVSCVANQGEAIRNNPPNKLHKKDTTGYDTGENQSLPFMRPVLMLTALLIFKMIIVYAMDMFDGFPPVK